MSAEGCPTNTQKTPSPNSKEPIKKDPIKPTLSDRVPQGQGTPLDPSSSPNSAQPLSEIDRAKVSNKDQGDRDSKSCPDNSKMIRSKEDNINTMLRIQEDRMKSLLDELDKGTFNSKDKADITKYIMDHSDIVVTIGGASFIPKEVLCDIDQRVYYTKALLHHLDNKEEYSKEQKKI